MSGGTPPPGHLEVGRIGKPHGVRGDVFVSLTSDLPQRHAPGATFVVLEADSVRTLVLVTSRPQQNRWVMHFEGVDERNGAEKLTNKFLYAEPVEADDALWVHELIGSRVVDTKGNVWGRCTGVLNNPAHDILEIEGTLLVPAPFVVSHHGGETIIDPPDGLRDLSIGGGDPDDGSD